MYPPTPCSFFTIFKTHKKCDDWTENTALNLSWNYRCPSCWFTVNAVLMLQTSNSINSWGTHGRKKIKVKWKINMSRCRSKLVSILILESLFIIQYRHFGHSITMVTSYYVMLILHHIKMKYWLNLVNYPINVHFYLALLFFLLYLNNPKVVVLIRAAANHVHNVCPIITFHPQPITNIALVETSTTVVNMSSYY